MLNFTARSVSDAFRLAERRTGANRDAAWADQSKKYESRQGWDGIELLEASSCLAVTNSGAIRVSATGAHNECDHDAFSLIVPFFLEQAAIIMTPLDCRYIFC